jgi:NAD(P)H-dependent FMN reductase
MKVLIITQSSDTGINRRIAQECEAVVRDNWVNRPKTKMINVSEVTNEDLSDFDYQVWIVPEWNNSFPYMFKKIIDDSGYPSILERKEILLIGTSETNFGNIMGITHLEHILEWIGAIVFEKRICISNLSEKRNETYIIDERTIKAINLFIGGEC